ncbi:glycine-rich domain-containing protein [Lysinibacillus sp. F5]|uniref:glycine-rich domain-containing protein n=1 Tax=Lysinibacillus sp. F5 TaxID=1700846 RepID=UPI0007385D03|nr:hypothetical protein [Lysinibacillus sp. F5]KUF36723.1 hypothetical protein AK833_02120 [Lysinibacillus sp. F5]
MSTDTANYGFTKDNEDDFYNVNVVNANLDKIDTEMKRIEDESKSFNEQVTDNTNAIANANTKLDTHIKDDVGHVRYAGTSTGTNAMTIATDVIPVENPNVANPVPKTGSSFKFIKSDGTNTGAVTVILKYTNLGNKISASYQVLDSQAKPLNAGDLTNGVPYTLVFNGSAFFLQGSGSGVVTRNNARYNTAGTYELTVPKGVSKITAYIFGAGGGGGCYSAAINRGGGGGAGGAYLLASINVTPGQKLTIVVGKGGSGSGDVSQPGLSGGYSYVRSNGVDFIAGGGGGGGSGNSGGSNLSGLGGEGGVYNKTYVPPGGSYDNKDGTLYSFAANGLTNLSERLVSFGGGDGAYFTNSSDGGGGGGAASDLSGGKKGSFSYGGAYGPYATNIYGGPGGAGALYSASAKPGNAPGGGGGGGGYVNNGYVGGANGADGRVMLYW